MLCQTNMHAHAKKQKMHVEIPEDHWVGSDASKYWSAVYRFLDCLLLINEKKWSSL